MHLVSFNRWFQSTTFLFIGCDISRLIDCNRSEVKTDQEFETEKKKPNPEKITNLDPVCIPLKVITPPDFSIKLSSFNIAISADNGFFATIKNGGSRHWGDWQAYFYRSLGVNRSEGTNRLEGISDPPGDPLPSRSNIRLKY